MLSAENLDASHRGRRVLHDIVAAVEPGNLVVLLGPNASGKSTLLRSLAGIHRPENGRLSVNKLELSRLSAAELARRISYVPQENLMAFAYTVGELVGLGGAGGRVAEALTELDLNGLEKRSVLTLSGGERQRAAIARAVAQNADFLLLDEPTAHLDLRHQKSLFDLLIRLVRDEKKGVLVALHDLNLAAAYADRIILLKEGRIVASGTPAVALTAEILAEVYGIPISIQFDDAESRPRLSIF